VALALSGVAGATFRKIAAGGGGPEAVFASAREGFPGAKGVRRSLAGKLVSAGLFEAAEAEICRAAEAGVDIVPFDDSRYPGALREIHSPPLVLYVKGKFPRTDKVWIAVVGSRLASIYGMRVAQVLGRDFAASGAVVVSGMARGIDAATHEGALAADGLTVAVLACGLSHVYPAENRKLADRITRRGALVSEYPMDMKPRREYFPARNRIVSGLSRAVVVVEADEKSGALITADAALEQGRDVYAVPGNVDSACSRGTNRLIKQGAKPVTSAEDVLEECPASARQREDVPALSVEEKEIVTALKNGALSIDSLVDRTGLAAPHALRTLSALRLKGLVHERPGKQFCNVR
jgi:DNA processing protein